LLARWRQVFAGAVDVKVKRGHGRLKRRTFPPLTRFRGTLQGKSYLTRVADPEEVVFEIKRVTAVTWADQRLPSVFFGRRFSHYHDFGSEAATGSTRTAE
jgi:hypothetical protein